MAQGCRLRVPGEEAGAGRTCQLSRLHPQPRPRPPGPALPFPTVPCARIASPVLGCPPLIGSSLLFLYERPEAWFSWEEVPRMVGLRQAQGQVPWAPWGQAGDEDRCRCTLALQPWRSLERQGHVGGSGTPPAGRGEHGGGHGAPRPRSLGPPLACPAPRSAPAHRGGGAFEHVYFNRIFNNTRSLNPAPRQSTPIN